MRPVLVCFIIKGTACFCWLVEGYVRTYQVIILEKTVRPNITHLYITLFSYNYLIICHNYLWDLLVFRIDCKPQCSNSIYNCIGFAMAINVSDTGN